MVLQKKNLKKVQAKIEDMIPVITTRQAKKKAQMKAGANLAAGIVAGVAVGAVAGLLLASKPGKETRQDIKKKAEKVGGAIKDKTVEVFEAVKEKSTEAVSAVKHKLDKKTELDKDVESVLKDAETSAKAAEAAPAPEFEVIVR